MAGTFNRKKHLEMMHAKLKAMHERRRNEQETQWKSAHREVIVASDQPDCLV